VSNCRLCGVGLHADSFTCRGVSITTPLQYFFLLFWLLTLSIGGHRLTRTFLQCSEKGCKRYPRGVNFGPLIGGNLAHVVKFFSEQWFPVTRNKIDFPRNFDILFPESGPRYSYQFFFPDGPWASPYNECKNLAPENLAKMGVKFFGGGAISVTWGQNCRGRLKSGKGVYYRTLWHTK